MPSNISKPLPGEPSLTDWKAEQAAAQAAGMEYYARRLVYGVSGIEWLEDEYVERLLSGWRTGNGELLVSYIRAGDWKRLAELQETVAVEVVKEYYDRIMSEAAEAAAEKLLDD